jgi:hypothetical protein
VLASTNYRTPEMKSGNRLGIVAAAALDDDTEKKRKKPARERDPNDYLSLSRSEPEQLAGSSERLNMRSPHFKPVSEKGRAGGRARQPARPSAVSHSRVFETAVAIGVDSCEVRRVSSFYVPAGVQPGSRFLCCR